MESTARLLWGEKRAKELSELISLRAAALARMDMVMLSQSDGLDSLGNQ